MIYTMLLMEMPQSRVVTHQIPYAMTLMNVKALLTVVVLQLSVRISLVHTIVAVILVTPLTLCVTHVFKLIWTDLMPIHLYFQRMTP